MPGQLSWNLFGYTYEKETYSHYLTRGSSYFTSLSTSIQAFLLGSSVYALKLQWEGFITSHCSWNEPALLPNHLEKIEDRTRVNGGNSVKWRRREKMRPGRERCRTANNGKARTWRPLTTFAPRRLYSNERPESCQLHRLALWMSVFCEAANAKMVTDTSLVGHATFLWKLAWIIVVTLAREPGNLGREQAVEAPW